MLGNSGDMAAGEADAGTLAVYAHGADVFVRSEALVGRGLVGFEHAEERGRRLWLELRCPIWHPAFVKD